MSFEWQFMLDIRSDWVNKQQSANWEASVRKELIAIASVDAGKALLNGIRWWNKWVPILPYDFSQGACNAFADEKLGTARNGQAYGAIVRYSPFLHAMGGACYVHAPANRGGSGNEILFHEMVHAFRRVSGKRHRETTSGGLLNYDSNEEFHAIVVTNIYVTDPTNKHATGLRRDHQDYQPLDADLSTSLGFFESSQNAFDLVKTFCTDHPGLSGALAKVPATFNPIAAFVNNPAEAQKRSKSAIAVIRDVNGWVTAINRIISGD